MSSSTDKRNCLVKDNDLGEDIEWFDAYEHAYRIASENHNYLKSWLTKISFHQLINEIDHGYVKNIDFGLNRADDKALIRNYLQQAVASNDPKPLIRAYTEKTRFFSQLNHDLAIGGSGFRFQISYAISNLVFRDNEPPDGFGHYIFVAIVSHHRKLLPYRIFTGVTYRGVSMKSSDFEKYQEGLSIMNRTFVSTSTSRQVAEDFIKNKNDSESNLSCPVICIYHIRHPSTSLDLHTISVSPNENEILILPFKTFKIIRVTRNLNAAHIVELDELMIH